jgi:hypothetical protein
MIESSSELGELAIALAGFHAECPKVLKESFNSHHNQKYADLGDILGVINPVLAKHGLSVVQFPIEPVTLVTMLVHKSGQYVRSSSQIRAMETIIKRGTGGAPDTIGITPQSYGSALTYQRRYTLAAMLSLCIDEDDDAERAERAARRNNAFTAPSNPVPNNAFDAKPKAEAKPEVKQESEAKPLEKLSEAKIAEIEDKLKTASDEVLPKMEQALSQYGISQQIDKETWGTLAGYMLLRWIEVAPPAQLGIPTNRIVGYKSKGLLTEEQHKYLTDKLQERIESMKG